MMSVQRSAIGMAFGAITLLLTACGGSSVGGEPATFAGTDGETLYAAACASCHGANLGGTNRGPPFLDSIYRPGHHADASFVLAVRRGVRSHHWDLGSMSAISGLTDEQVRAITRFVRERQRAAGIE